MGLKINRRRIFIVDFSYIAKMNHTWIFPVTAQRTLKTKDNKRRGRPPPRGLWGRLAWALSATGLDAPPGRAPGRVYYKVVDCDSVKSSSRRLTVQSYIGRSLKGLAYDYKIKQLTPDLFDKSLDDLADAGGRQTTVNFPEKQIKLSNLTHTSSISTASIANKF